MIENQTGKDLPPTPSDGSQWGSTQCGAQCGLSPLAYIQWWVPSLNLYHWCQKWDLVNWSASPIFDRPSMMCARGKWVLFFQAFLFWLAWCSYNEAIINENCPSFFGIPLEEREGGSRVSMKAWAWWIQCWLFQSHRKWPRTAAAIRPNTVATLAQPNHQRCRGLLLE